MANWKKVIVSGSNAELRDISASTVNYDGGLENVLSITASGFWHGYLPENENLVYVVVYDPTDGQMHLQHQDDSLALGTN